jgi:hypothetical protein
MTKDELKKMLGDAEEIVFKGKCHDCGQDTTVLAGIENGKIIAGGGAVYKVPPPSIRKDNIFIKCEECFEKDPVLSNFRKTEVYSRVVGYLRPVSQYNAGKQAERNLRKDYNIEKAIKEAE